MAQLAQISTSWPIGTRPPGFGRMTRGAGAQPKPLWPRRARLYMHDPRSRMADVDRGINSTPFTNHHTRANTGGNAGAAPISAFAAEQRGRSWPGDQFCAFSIALG